ncbi:MAG: histidine-type phosphatase [Prevotella sp.]|nr:histidine-type phosphatase [Prevotella sp.]
MKKTVLLSFVLTFCLGMYAQTDARLTDDRLSAHEEITRNRYLCGSNYLDYDRYPATKPLTKAPKGYEPFYMSHYGRHGSRWLIGKRDYSRVADVLEKAEGQQKLTEKGCEVLEQLHRFMPSTVKRLGDLTTVGERQHHGIGKRMTEHFPEIFKKKGVAVDARSTVVPRCILSMMAECEELMAANPTARIHNDVSESLQYYLNQPWDERLKEHSKRVKWETKRAYQERITKPERLMQVLFNDLQWVKDSVNAVNLMYDLFEVASNMQSHDTDIDLLSLFTASEMYDQWRYRNWSWYLSYGAAPQTGGIMPFSQRNLLRNIIETADTVIGPSAAQARTQATLRFGHEVCVMPLACLLELGQCGVSVENPDSLDRYWRNYDIFPMGCNIQLVFYRPKRGRQGDVLVKALLNERETMLPVGTTQWPYYRWNDLRSYYMEKLRKYENEK